MRWLAGLCVPAALCVQAAPVLVPVESPSRLQTLEEKAEECDRYRAQCTELQQSLDEMLALIGPSDEKHSITNTPVVGRLSKLIEKAALADALQRELDDVYADQEKLVVRRDALNLELMAMLAEQEKNAEALKNFLDQKAGWEAKTAGLKETIERLLLGEFEYYEVKDGDSLQSIASSPMIYGNPARATWLKQVNAGRIKHLENLQSGEMLIIPRFPRNGSYEF